MTFSGEYNEFFTHDSGQLCLSLKDGSWVYLDGIFKTCTELHEVGER